MKTPTYSFPSVVVKKEAKVEQIASSESDASYLDEEESTSGETSSSIPGNSYGHVGDDVDMLAQEVADYKNSEEEKEMANHLHNHIIAKQDPNHMKRLALSLHLEMTLMLEHDWTDDKAKTSSLHRTMVELIGLVKESVMNKPYTFDWLISFDPSSVQMVDAEQLKELLHISLGPKETRSFMPLAFDLDVAKTIVCFIRRAFRSKADDDEEADEEQVDEDDNGEELQVDELYQFVLTCKSGYYVNDLLDDFIDRQSPFVRLVKTLCKMVDSPEDDRRLFQLRDVIGHIADIAREHDTLEWILKYDCTEDSPVEMRSKDALLKVVVKAIEYASSIDEADDKVKKQCRLIVRFFRTSYLCKSCGQGVPA